MVLVYRTAASAVMSNSIPSNQVTATSTAYYRVRLVTILAPTLRRVDTQHRLLPVRANGEEPGGNWRHLADQRARGKHKLYLTLKITNLVVLAFPMVSL